MGILSRSLVEADVETVTRELGVMARELLTERRLRRVLEGALRLTRAVERENLIRRAARAARTAPEVLAVLHEALSVQRRTLATQEVALGVARQTLVVARETEKHAKSLDRKTGGPLLGPTR